MYTATLNFTLPDHGSDNLQVGIPILDGALDAVQGIQKSAKAEKLPACLYNFYTEVPYSSTLPYQNSS